MENPYGTESKPIHYRKAEKIGADELKRRGYDGVIASEGRQGISYAVFDPIQIKSAIGNQGTFDPENPDIRMSLGGLGFGSFGKPKDDFVSRAGAINARWKEWGMLRGVFDSASDVLRRNGVTRPIAEAIDAFYDGTRENMGIVNTIHDPAADKLRKMKRKDREEALDTFERIIRSREQKDGNEAAFLANAPQVVRDMVAAWDKVADVTGTMNQEAGVQVMTKDGKWRGIGKIKGFFPRSMKEDVARAIAQPEKYPEVWREMANQLKDAGLIQEATFEAANEYLGRQANLFKDVSREDYFAGIEQARGDALPEWFYDYSWDAAMAYKDKWAENLSRIQALGQRSITGKDMIDDIADGITDTTTKNYLKAVQDRLYNVIQNDSYIRGATALNTLVTGLQLGNPATALLNLIGGTTLNFQAFGLRKSIRGLGTELTDLVANIKEARKIGILIDDYMMLTQDAAQAGMSENLQKFTSGMMKIGGYTPMETFIRTHAYVTAKTMLRDSLGMW